MDPSRPAPPRPDWHRAGREAYHARPGQRRFPPAADPDAQHAWLAGFRSAWAHDLSSEP